VGVDSGPLKVDGVEISDFVFHDLDTLGEVLIERLARRIRAAADVRNTDRHVYLEHGLTRGPC
jgi:8-oxo-dGTP diphosphatase